MIDRKYFSKYYAKWDKYKIGDIHFIKNNENHPHRKVFVDFVINNDDITKIVEAGPGEMIEYKRISERKSVQYSIIDVSNVFINNCKSNYPDVKIYNCPVEDIDRMGIKNKYFNVFYAASVLEHSRNIYKMIKNCTSIAERFHFVLYKWAYGGSLKSQYHKGKKFCSTFFNIDMLLELIGMYGTIECTDIIIKKTGERIPHDKYRAGKTGENRTGDYLIIYGKSKL